MGQTSRRNFLKTAAGVAVSVPLATCLHAVEKSQGPPPNILLLITDDHGYGDLGCHGNPYIQTPNLDRLHDESTRLTKFHVSPVCSPTRSSLMTGRYNYRTGVVDTFQGRSMMYPDEVTLAEALSAHGYHTGIFGKWHLGDNYPMRAMDQGFQHSLVHKGGGICQPSEPRNNSYFDPILKLDGRDMQCNGYCSDIFTNSAVGFIENHRSEPFFAYLAFNAPHDPLLVDERYSSPYLAKGLNEKTAKVYGMITNLDENVGRVLATLKTLGLEENTLVIFLTDNGAFMPKGAERYNAGMRGQKGTVYEGGIRVPCFIRWPARLPHSKDIDRIAAHIDLFPTLLEACSVPLPKEVHLDGKSLVPLLSGTASDWPDRALFFQWHRGDEPQRYNNCAVLTQRYKLVNGKELYDLENDPGEQTDIASHHPDLVAQMRARYEAWFKDVSSTRGYAPPRIMIGSTHENPSVLTRQDWRGAESWRDGQVGYWEVQVARSGNYEIAADFPESTEPGEAHVKLNGAEERQPVRANDAICRFPAARIPSGDGRLEVWVTRGGKTEGARQVTVCCV